MVLLLCSFSLSEINEPVTKTSENPIEEDVLVDVSEFAQDSYNQLGVKDLFFKPYKLALNGYFKLLESGQLRNTKFLTIVDMTKSANIERLFIISIINILGLNEFYSLLFLLITV